MDDFRSSRLFKGFRLFYLSCCLYPIPISGCLNHTKSQCLIDSTKQFLSWIFPGDGQANMFEKFNRHFLRDTSSVNTSSPGDSTKVETRSRRQRGKSEKSMRVAMCRFVLVDYGMMNWAIGKPINQWRRWARSVMAHRCLFSSIYGMAALGLTITRVRPLNPVNKCDDPPSSGFMFTIFIPPLFMIRHFLQLNHYVFMVRPPFSRSPFSQLHQNFS